MSIDFSNRSNYEILGVSEFATDAEITEKYNQLKAKYSEDRFLPGEAGNNAAQMLQVVENAYENIMMDRKAPAKSEQKAEEFTQSYYTNVDPYAQEERKTYSDKPMYSDVDELIKAGKIDEAQQRLDDYSDRLAEWHYMQAVIYYKKNWGNECKKQLEIAMTKDPDNQKYKTTHEKLCKEMEFKNKNFQSGNATQKQSEPARDFDPYDRQMGGEGCLNSCCQCIACNLLLNCCCNCH